MNKTHHIIAALLSAFFVCTGCSDDPTAAFIPVEKAWKKIKNELGIAAILDQYKRYSLGMEELIIRDFFQDRQGLFFVDVGCAWPVKASNTYYLEKHLGWTGIGIDALNSYAAEWKEKRPRSKFFCHLVSNTSGESTSFFKSEEAGISSVHESIADGTFFGVNLDTKELHLTSITLNDLLDREGINSVNLLSIDVEGHEVEVLEGLDLDRFSPELIVIEIMGPNKERVTQYMNQHGYYLIERYEPLDDINLYFSRTP